MHVAQPEALHELGVQIDLAVLPGPEADERGAARGVACLPCAREAVCTLIGRVEAWIGLSDEGRLPVDVPVAVGDPGLLSRRQLGRGRVRPAQLAVETQAQHVDVEARIVVCARWEGGADVSEPAVEIFEARRPVRRDRDFGADSHRPACDQPEHLVLVFDDARRLHEARLRPGEAARGVNQPVIGGVTHATAHRADGVELVRDVGLGSGA